MVAMEMKYTIDLDAPLYKLPSRTLLVEGDKLANQLVVEVVRGREPVSLDGIGVTGEMIRTGEVMPLTGSASGNVATLTLPQACYAVPGGFELQMRLVNTADGITRTILILIGKIERKGSGTIIDVGEVVPNLDDLLAQIAAMKQATDAAQEVVAQYDAKVAEQDGKIDILTGDMESLESEFAPSVFVLDSAGNKAIEYKVFAGNKYTVSRIAQESDAGRCEIRVYDADGNKVDTMHLEAGQTQVFVPAATGDVKIYIPSTAALPQTFEIANNSGVNYRVQRLSDSVYHDISVDDFVWGYGSIDANGNLLNRTTRVRTERLEVDEGVSIALLQTGYKFGVYLFADATTSELLESRTMGTGAYTTTQAGYLALCCGASEEAEITELPLHYAESVLDVSGTTTGSKADQKLDALGYLSSYDRTGRVYFGSIPNAWYKCDSVQHQFGRNSTAAEVIEAFHDLAVASNGYITETVIGSTNDGVYSIMMYDLNPVKQATPGGMVNRECPTIIVTTCHHGEEKIPCYGWLETINNLVNRPWESDALSYIRAHVRILYIPIVNPSGFDAYTRTNYSGVDLNRNYSAGWSEDGESGAEPFDQGETAAVRSIIQRHPEAVLLMDNHGYGSGVVTDALNVNWISLFASKDSVHTKLCAALRAYNAQQTFRFAHDYGFSAEGTIGKLTTNATGGTIKSFANACGIPALNCEGSNGFQAVTAYSDDAKRYNSEISVNVIMACLGALAQ